MSQRISFTVDLATLLPNIRPLHGVNNGPIAFGGLVDLSAFHRELRIPFVRLHDPQWPNPAVVDIPTIFPRFEADPADPASYYFARTDDYIASIIATGAQIIYRLGTSIEHTARKYHTHPPADFDKWADICLHIIRHYNEGWAEGFRHGIRYWEIWNEPEIGAPMWSGTLKEYLRLYAITARAIKAHDSALKVGGPAAAYPLGPFLEQFLAWCNAERLPLDFCTWHTYTADPHELKSRSEHVRSLLDRYGYLESESHLNEWNYRFTFKGLEDRRRSYEEMQGTPGASFVAATLMLLQDSPIDVANYYTGDTSWFGLFDPYGVPRKTYYAFKAFVRLLETPQRVSCVLLPSDEKVVACAAMSEDGKLLRVLISNWDSAPKTLRLTPYNTPFVGSVEMRTFAVDSEHDFVQIEEHVLATEDLAFDASLPAYSIRLIELSAE
jgi:hypothetical protein